MPAARDHAEKEASGRRRPRLIFLLLGVLLAAALAAVLLALRASGTSTASGTAVVSAGRPAPRFALPALDGARKKVGVPVDGGGGGRPAVLLFFASWCPPCRREIPALAATYRRQQEEHSPLAKVAVIGVDANDPTSNALAFVRSSGVTFPVGADVSFAVTQTLFGFSHLPESVFVEGNGTIAGIHLGPLSPRRFSSWERRLLASG
jgi:thiol-disulfide isomerase/thioredoxin